MYSLVEAPAFMRGKGALQRSAKDSIFILRFITGDRKGPGLKPISKSLVLRWTEVQPPAKAGGFHQKAFPGVFRSQGAKHLADVSTKCQLPNAKG
jgi:hypothetical protein